MKCRVKLTWDDEARVWIAESSDVPGLVLESGSLDALIERVRFAAPELFELNTGYKGDVSLAFTAKRELTTVS